MRVPKDYTHTTDSTPNTNGTRRKHKLAGKVMLVSKPGECMCGCGKPAKRLFGRGHDPRVHGILRRAQLADLEVAVVRDDNLMVDSKPIEVGRWIAAAGYAEEHWVGELE